MKLIFCLAKDNSMMFFGKRQSKDEVLREWIIKYINGAPLWMSRYSANQFESNESIIVDDDYMSKAAVGDYCFVEDKGYCVVNASEIILCKWNRKYPGDKFFETDLKKEGFEKVEELEIKGKSHDKITIEIYKRK